MRFLTSNNGNRKITATVTQKKTVKTQLGEIDLKVPRDKTGEYEPKIMGKLTVTLRKSGAKLIRSALRAGKKWDILSIRNVSKWIILLIL